MGIPNEITNREDIIDSRAITARIEYLEAQEDRSEDEDSELKALKALAGEGEASPDWKYGETLIRESYFKDYAQQLADDIGAINEGATWPNNCIDWDRAARELRFDYFAVDFDGVTYLIHA